MAHEEIWKQCLQDPGYEVSSLGRVKSKRREVFYRISSGKECSRVFNEKLLRPWVIRNTGYLQVMLGGRKKYSVHRLVASAFCKGEEDGLCVNHKNGARSDNRAENLEWVSYSENCAHAFRELSRQNPCKGRTGSEHPKSKAVISRDPANGCEVFYEAAIRAAESGFDSGSISRCCNGKARLHKGLEWRYAGERASQEVPDEWEPA